MTPDLARRPRTATEIVSVAVQLYGRAPVQCLLVSAVLYAPVLLFNVTTAKATALNFSLSTPLPSMPGGGLDVDSLLAPIRGGLALSIVGACLSALSLTLIDGALAWVGSKLYLGGDGDAWDGLRAVGRRFVSVVAITVLKYLALGLGLVCFLFPALYVEARFFAPVQVALIEGAGIGTAFRRSGVLSVGVKGHILTALAVVGLPFLVLGLVDDVVSVFTNDVFLTQVLPALLVIVLYPAVALCQLVLYYDTRIRSEGDAVRLSPVEESRGSPAGVPA